MGNSNATYVGLNPIDDIYPASKEQIDYVLNISSKMFNEAAKLLGVPIEAKNLSSEKVDDDELKECKHSKDFSNLSLTGLQKELFCELKLVVRVVKYSAAHEPEKITPSLLYSLKTAASESLKELKELKQ